MTIIFVYEHDLIITSSDSILFQKLTYDLRSKFSLNHLGFLSYFLCVQVKRNANALHLCEQKYVEEFLLRCEHNNRKSLVTPTSLGEICLKYDGVFLSNPSL